VADGLLAPYQARQSPVHRLPAGAKLSAAVAFIFAVVLLPRGAWTALAVCALALGAVAGFSRVRPRPLLRRLLLLEPFVIGVAALSLLQRGGGAVFLAMLARSTLCLGAMVLLTATTRFTDVLGVLWRLHFPAMLVTSLALTTRYLTLLLDEAGRMTRARRSRTFAGGRVRAWHGAASVAGQLFVRSTERAERIYDAMCARGWRT
jgi:cobalt/nickel transport system permease protein